MESVVKDILESRISRANLIPGTNYIKVIQIYGIIMEEDVGTFVCSYRMGSGDGMTVHWEFKKDGIVTTIEDQMWGSVSGSDLTYYKVK